jgi:hypothetical protein
MKFPWRGPLHCLPPDEATALASPKKGPPPVPLEGGGYVKGVAAVSNGVTLSFIKKLRHRLVKGVYGVVVEEVLADSVVLGETVRGLYRNVPSSPKDRMRWKLALVLIVIVRRLQSRFDAHSDSRRDLPLTLVLIVHFPSS